MLGALVSLISGYFEARALGKLEKEAAEYFDAWFRLLASVIITSYVVFPGIWGITALSMWSTTGIWVALGVGFATALSITSAVVYILWTRNPLTKGIAIAVPNQLQKLATETDVTITERK